MMDLVKKNMVSIVCGVVALLAVGALFWPVQGYFADLKQRVDERVGVYTALNGLNTKQRNWPNTSLSAGAPVKQLEMYPTAKIVERGKALVDQMKAESGLMYKTAWELNKHEELSPGALTAGGAANIGRFVAAYKQHVDLSKYQERVNSNLVKIMKAGFLPHPEQLLAARQQARQQIFARGVPQAGGGFVNQAELDEELKIVEMQIPIQFRQKTAQESLVYLVENSLDPYPPIMLPAPGGAEQHQVWVAQVNYWIQEDIAKAIAMANEGATNVSDSAVKMLVDIASSAPAVYKPAAAGTQVTPSDLPKPETEPKFNYVTGITGRFTSPLYDVVPFKLQMIVDATQTQRVLQALARNKFITVTTCNIDIQDVSEWETRQFTMGTNPLVMLTLNCETLLFREWTIPLMPAPIKRGLGLPETATTAAQ